MHGEVRAHLPTDDSATGLADRRYGLYVKHNFPWSETLSRMILDVVREYYARVEYYFIDVFYFEAIPLPRTG